jgi:hypothetical protein
LLTVLAAIVAIVIGGIVLAALGVLGRRAKGWIRWPTRWRPSIPRTRVVITDARGFWGTAQAKNRTQVDTAFNVSCTATNLGSPGPLKIVEGRVIGLGGKPVWCDVCSWLAGDLVIGASLETHKATELQFDGVVERRPPGVGAEIRVRLELVDQYDRKHRSRRFKLRDGDPPDRQATTA